MTFPVTFGPDAIPRSVATLLETVLPKLIEDDHPALVVLQEQLRRSVVESVEMTGVGFFVNFIVPPDVPLTEPRDFVGGHASIELTGVEHGASCVLFVRDGQLSMFEGFTYVDEWSLDAEVLSVSSIGTIWPSGPKSASAAPDV